MISEMPVLVKWSHALDAHLNLLLARTYRIVSKM